MLCRFPFQKGDALFPCGQCIPCRINRRRVWTHRIMLESLCHDYSSFVTLTYDNKSCPATAGGVPTLVAEHARDWLKRYRASRSRSGYSKVRYYLVGEYGDASWRPHYHAALFGVESCEYGITRKKENCCAACNEVRDTWGFGHIALGDLTVQSAAYIAGYVTKKLTRSDDPRLDGRDPEFARMSLKPGIGGDAMWDVASTLLAFGLDEKGDVPAGLRHGPKILPLGRYLRRRLRTYVGKDAGAPDETLAKAKEELSALWESTKGITRRGEFFKTLAVNASEAEAARIINRANIWKKRGSI